MGNFKIEAVCDDYLIQERMEDLLPKVVPNLT